MARKKENKRSDGYYEYKCIVDRKYDGKPVYKSFYSKKSKAEARQKAEEYKIELAKGKKKDLVTFYDWSERFLTIKKENVKITTYAHSYVSTIRLHLQPYFADKPLMAINKTDIEEYVILKQKTLKPATIRLQISCLNTIFAEAVDSGYIDYNPCANIKIKSERKPEKKVYTKEQVDLVLDYCKKDKFGLPVFLILSYGMSKSEFLGIKFDDIDFENLTLSINKSVVPGNKYHKGDILADTKNKYRNRVIAISQEAADFIKEKVQSGYLAEPNGTRTPISTTFRSRYEAFMVRMHKYYIEQGIDVPELNIHELRHTRASIWVNEGRNLFAIAEMLGWSDLSMLRKVYGHADIQKLRNELDI